MLQHSQGHTAGVLLAPHVQHEYRGLEELRPDAAEEPGGALRELGGGQAEAAVLRDVRLERPDALQRLGPQWQRVVPLGRGDDPCIQMISLGRNIPVGSNCYQ